ncbi:hypothetical protein ES705_36889 [subsurface metagenome]|jgi:integrase
MQALQKKTPDTLLVPDLNRHPEAVPDELEALCYQFLTELLRKYHSILPPAWYDGRSDSAVGSTQLAPYNPNNPNAAGISSGGDSPVLRELVYNELMGLGKTEAAAKEWGAVAAEFELVCGQKGSYTRADVMTFLIHLRKRGLLQSTIEKDLKAIKVVARVQGWQFPKLPLRRMNPDEVRRTIFAKETVGSLITLGRQGLLSRVELCYLALATTYGLRRIEMVKLNPSHFPDEHHLVVDTAKGGRRTIHLIPPQIAPYLAHFRHYEPDSLTHLFHRIARKSGLSTEAGYGWHSIRRSLATELSLTRVSTLNVLRFMRWSETSIQREFGELPIYAKRDQERIDREIFQSHPFLPYWQ